MKSKLVLALVLASATVLSLGACATPDTAPAASSVADAGSKDLQALGDRGLVIGTEGTYRPFSFHDSATNKLTGYDVEVAQAVGKKLGVKVSFQETQWDGIFAALDAKRFDVIANQVSITPERQAKYSFSEPYTVSPGVIVTRTDDTDIKSFADLKGKKTAQSNTSNWYALAQKYGAEVQAVEGWAQAVAAARTDRRHRQRQADAPGLRKAEPRRQAAHRGDRRRRGQECVHLPQGKYAGDRFQCRVEGACRRRHVGEDFGKVFR